MLYDECRTSHPSLDSGDKLDATQWGFRHCPRIDEQLGGPHECDGEDEHLGEGGGGHFSLKDVDTQSGTEINAEICGEKE